MQIHTAENVFPDAQSMLMNLSILTEMKAIELVSLNVHRVGCLRTPQDFAFNVALETSLPTLTHEDVSKTVTGRYQNGQTIAQTDVSGTVPLFLICSLKISLTDAC